MSRKLKEKPPWEMNMEELRRTTAKYDREFAIDEFQPLTPAMRKKWERARWKKPSASNGKRSVAVSLESLLVVKLDRMAAEQGVSRSALVAQGVRKLLK